MARDVVFEVGLSGALVVGLFTAGVYAGQRASFFAVCLGAGTLFVVLTHRLNAGRSPRSRPSVVFTGSSFPSERGSGAGSIATGGAVMPFAAFWNALAQVIVTARIVRKDTAAAQRNPAHAESPAARRAP